MRAQLERVLARTIQAIERSERVALAVVVGVTGSAYRRTGAAMAIGDGWTEGSVSAGCLESDVVLRAGRAMDDGRSGTVEYDTGDRSPFALGIGCGGRVRIAVMPLGPADAEALRAMSDRAEADAPFRWSLPLGSGLELRRTFPAPDHLHVYGAGSDSGSICDLAARVGFRVTVVDHRSGLLGRPHLAAARERIVARPGEAFGLPVRRGRVFAVVKTHDLERDRAWLELLRASRAGYIGVMGPAARVAELVDTTGGPDARIYGPVGLDLGGDGPDAVALSVVAEVRAVASGRVGGPLRALVEAC